MRCQDDTVRIIGKPSKLWLGESSYPIGKIYMSGEITGNWKDSSDSLKITGCSSASIGTISNCTSLSMSSGSLTGCNSASIGKVTVSNILPASDDAQIGNTSSWFSVIFAKEYPTSGSDIRLKDNINKIQSDFAVKFINAQNPVSYTFKNEKNAQIQYGIIAQELESTIQDMGLNSTSLGILHTPKHDDEYYGIRYTSFIPLLISYCQSLYQDLSVCKQEIKTLQNSLSKVCEVDK